MSTMSELHRIFSEEQQIEELMAYEQTQSELADEQYMHMMSHMQPEDAHGWKSSTASEFCPF